MAETQGVACTIDDVALTACRFWPLSETNPLITEDIVRRKIDSHFLKKNAGRLNFEVEFSNDLKAATEDSECEPLSEEETQKKFRNTADNINNYFRLLGSLGLVSTSAPNKIERDRWSLSNFSHGKTGKVAPCQIRLTVEGRNVLLETIALRPIWFLDIIEYFGLANTGGTDDGAILINDLASFGRAPLPDGKMLEMLNRLGVNYSVEDRSIVLKEGIDFEWAYDMHQTGASIRKLFSAEGEE